jgi:hypothetical protein
MRHAAVFAMALAAVAWGTGSAHADLITDGTFASPDVGGGWNGFNSSGSSAAGGVNGWTDSLGHIEIDNSAMLGLPSYNGFSQSLEVNSTAPDTVSQTVSGLTPGARYDLSFGYGVRPGSGTQELEVFFNGVLLDTYFATNSDTGFWTSENYLVSPTGSSAVLTFEGVLSGGPASYGNEISDVSLVAVDESSSLALFASGLLGLSLMRGRRASARI